MPNIWIHINEKEQFLFFSNIARLLAAKGHALTVSCEPEAAGGAGEFVPMRYDVIGNIEPSALFTQNSFSKELTGFAAEKRFDAVLAFPDKRIGKTCKKLDLPYVTVLDDETDRQAVSAARQADAVLAPDAMREAGKKLPGIYDPIYYPGLLEDFYVSSIDAAGYLRNQFSIPDQALACVFRPSEYFGVVNAPDDALPRAILAYLLQKMVAVVILPHDGEQREALLKQDPGLIVAQPSDPASVLIAGSDLALGEGRTLRQAAAASVPAYTYTSGRLCAVDSMLIKNGEATVLRSRFDYHKIRLEKRGQPRPRPDNADALVQAVESVLSGHKEET